MKKIELIEKELIRMRNANELFYMLNCCDMTSFMKGNNKAIDNILDYIKELKK